MRACTKPVSLFVALAVFLLVGEPMLGAEAVSLQDIRWQSLPPTIRGVFVAPDGRLWFRDESRGDRHLTVVDLKRVIADAFRESSPRIDAIEPVLFEPSGRVWFSLRRADHPMLVGYDGKTWSEYAIADATDRVSGVCATEGRLNEGRANRVAGGAAWFILESGVLRFDGQRWLYQKLQDSTEFTPGSSTWCYRKKVWLAVSPEGTEAIASVSPDTFWIFRDGQWTRRVLKKRPEGDARRRRNEELSALVWSGDATAWYQTRAGELGRIGMASETKQEETSGVAALIKDLRNDRFEVREKATRALQELGVTIRGELENALANSDDLEERGRLNALLARISRPELDEDQPKDQVFESVHFARCQALFDDGLGRMFVVASTTEGKETDLVLIQDRDGHLTTMRGTEFAAGWRMRLNSDKTPIFARQGERLWLPGDDSEAPKLLDLKAMEFVDAVPHPTYGELHAVSREGRVFVSAPGSSRVPLLVYSPGASATEDVLKHSYVDCSSDLFAIGDDGAVWATDPSGHLIHFNGFQWNSAQGKTHLGMRALLPGHEDVLLVCCEHIAALYQGTQEIGAAQLTELLEQHQELVRKAFGPRAGIRHRVQFVGNNNYGLVADRDGNIWLVQPRGRLLVYADGVWHDTNEALVDGGASEGLAATLALVGDGSRVLVNELQLHRCDGGEVLFGGIIEGKPHFVKAPQNCRFGEMPRNLAASDGTVWIPSYTTGQHGASRVDQTGVCQELGNVGYPVLSDEAGNLWALELRNGGRDQINVCRDGQVAQHLQIPQLTDAGFLISDRPGSVYARTTLGLQHLVAEGPKLDSYRLGKLYPLEGIAGDRLGQLLSPYSGYGYSKYGYLVVLGPFAQGRSPEHKLYLIKLPATEPQ